MPDEYTDADAAEYTAWWAWYDADQALREHRAPIRARTLTAGESLLQDAIFELTPEWLEKDDELAEAEAAARKEWRAGRAANPRHRLLR